jgi:putative ABC transport system permease protein
MGELFRRIYYLLNRSRMDRELQNDIAVHREMMSPEMRADFGNPTLMQERAREASGWTWLERLIQDTRYALRILLKNPAFSVVAIVALGLGIGANTALFSVVYGVLVKPLPYTQGKQLVELRQSFMHSGAPEVRFSVKEIADYRQAHTLSQVEEYHGMSFILLDGVEPNEVRTGVVSAHFFDLLGMRPYLGRLFTEADETKTSDPVLVLSYPYWKNHYGGDPGVVGRKFRMNDRVHTVIGVLPPIPQYPREDDVYMPTVACPFRSSEEMTMMREHHMMRAFARLKPGQTLESGKREMSVMAAQFQKAYPDVYPSQLGFSAGMESLRGQLTRDVQPMLLVLLLFAGFVLMIACANVANLALARITRREQELAVRAALGASRGRLIRQLLTESTLLSLAGGLVGLFLASQCLSLLVTFVGRFTTRAAEVSINTPVLLFTLGLSLLTGILFGAAPALSQKLSLVGSLKEGANTSTSRAERHRLRNALAMGQVAISFVLLIGAGLMMRSFIKLQRVDGGYNGDHVLTATVPHNFTKYKSNAEIKDLFERIQRKLQASPGIVTVAVNSGAPLAPGRPSSIGFEIEGRPLNPKQVKPQTNLEVATPETFRLLGVPLVSGRTFTEQDNEKAPQVTIVSRSFAKHYFGDEYPVNKRVSADGGKTWVTIIGVVGDVRQYGLDHDPVDTAYLPMSQNPGGFTLLVKTVGDPLNYVTQVRKAILEVDPDQPLSDLKTLDELRSDSLAMTRLTSALLALFAALALVIAATGLSGVTALLVSQRTREIGIRLALGAQRGEVLAMVVKQSMRVVLIGLAAGIVAALICSRVLSNLLFKTPTTDPLTFVGVAFVLLAVGLLASYLPARRVTRVNPLIALRAE